MTGTYKLTQYSKGGGCGCKIAPAVLQQILQTGSPNSFPSLLVGNETSDDAAVYLFNNEQAIISTTDFFLPIVDDAGDFGKIAAANAISDVYAMGGKPLMAIAILGWPVDKIPAAVATEVLEGARAVCHAAGIPLAGGHTIDSSEPIFGLAVTGTAPVQQLKRNNTGQPGDILFLTKPLGVGVLSTALKRGLLQEAHYIEFIRQVTSLNKVGEALSAISGVHAMTDVTGFGLLGHLIEMAQGSRLSAKLDYAAIKKMEGFDGYLAQKVIPDATFRNWNSYSQKVQFEKGVNVMEAFNLLPDPQTNGGLLVAVDPAESAKVIAVLKDYNLGDFVAPIGQLIEKEEKTVLVG
ncbi:MAG TPA: selenide, water dikinase SelD [Flavisolibacter sp.]|nr:selenide, water dikinase SelD [Flavisolibacter sp.]